MKVLHNTRPAIRYAPIFTPSVTRWSFPLDLAGYFTHAKGNLQNRYAKISFSMQLIGVFSKASCRTPKENFEFYREKLHRAINGGLIHNGESGRRPPSPSKNVNEWYFQNLLGS